MILNYFCIKVLNNKVEIENNLYFDKFLKSWYYCIKKVENIKY